MIRILLSTRLGERRMTQSDLARVTGIRSQTILKICILQYVKESLENHSKKCSKQKQNTVILT